MNTLSQENSLLLVIDVQERLVASLEKDAIVNRSKIMVQAANILDIPTIVTEQYPKGLGNTVSAVSESFGENVKLIEKKAFSVLKEEGFLDLLKSYGKKQIIIGGIETHICVHQTVADLLQEGFEVYVAKDMCASRRKNEFKQGIELMKQNGAKITCVEIVLFEWLKTSKHPQFKEIQALIK